MTTAPTRPYVGVTGVVTAAEARETAVRLHVPAGWRPMVGVLVSRKTLDGVAVTNRRYPRVADIPAILGALPDNVFRTLHFNTRSDTDLDTQLAEVVEACTPPDAIQLNIVRPDSSAMARFHDRYPAVDLILQVNGSSLGGSRSPADVLRYVRGYRGLAGHVLLDLSGGNARTLEVDWAAESLLALAADCGAEVSLGVAGGLGPDARGLLGDLRLRVAGLRFSVDAEGGLREAVEDPVPGEPYQDRLALRRVAGYAAACTQAFTNA